MNYLLANPHHDAPLRELIREGIMPGWIRLAFGREPDFFHAIGVQGHTNQVLVAAEGDRVVGMGCRSIRQVFLNGAPADIGYLGGLRLHPDIRRTGALARGYAALRKLHEAAPVPLYLTTVIEDNTEARVLLTSGRAGLPHYIDRGRYITYAINLNVRRRVRPSPWTIRRGDEVGLDAILNFLEREGPRRQFFPALSAADFGTPLLRGLSPADFRVVLDGDGAIAGTAAAWDQHDFKQNIVQGYARPVAQLRPLINAALRLAGFRPLPAPGQNLHSLYVAFACVRGDNPAILRALLERIYAEHQRGSHHFLLLGLHEQDPLQAALRHFLAFRYTSRLYLVCWEDGLDDIQRLESDRVPYLELATL